MYVTLGSNQPYPSSPNRNTTCACTCTGAVLDGVIDGVDFLAPPVTTINILNLFGNIALAAGVGGIEAATAGVGEPLMVNIDTGAFQILTQGGGADGLDIRTNGNDSPIDLGVSGTLNVGQTGLDIGTVGSNSPVSIVNNANVTAEDDGFDIDTDGPNSPINHGSLTAEGEPIEARTEGDNSPITITNTGALVGNGFPRAGFGISIVGNNSPVTITNSGPVTVLEDAFDLDVFSENGSVTITNTGALVATGPNASGFEVIAVRVTSPAASR